MDLDLNALKNLITHRTDEIEMLVAGTGYLPKTVIGVGTYLLDNHGDFDVLSSKQQATFEKFIQPLSQYAYEIVSTATASRAITYRELRQKRSVGL